MQIAVFGMRYVGCVTAACLADMGHSRDNIRLSGPGGHRHPKVRKMIIVGSRKTVVYDDIAENKLVIL